ncbi:MAG: Cna B-type domain-containing protein, partial [Lachnospiraceae bacterium]|nr:Cna B-type domain-containing protein [Lachnospiraceae bacterium]
MVLFNISHDNIISELDIGSENVYNRVDFDFGTYVDWADFEYLPSGMQSVYAALIIDKPRENENYKLDSNLSYKVNSIQVFEDLINNGVYDDNVALYDTNGYDYNEVASKEVGISKRVKTSSGVYAHSGNVGLDEIYTYYIAISNSDTGSLNNLIIYDIIEEAALDNEESWKGTFESIDISSLQDMGCQPVVYYSTTQGLRYPEQLTTGTEYIWLNDSSVWSTTCPADKSTITAIAVDARKKSDNSDFNVPAGDSLGFSFNMKAPSELPSLTNPNALYAYNRPAYSCSFKATSNGIANWTSLIGSRVTVDIPTTTVEVQKVWEDFDNLYQKRPDGVNVQLKRNNVNIGSAITLDESNNWTYTFENLLELDSNGDSYVYSVEEVNVPTDYNCTYTGTMSSGLKVINTIDEVKVDIDVTKIWNDFYNKNNKRPSKIVLTLIGDEGKSTELIQDIELTGRTSTWKTTVSVPKYNNDGEEFTWTIKEETVPDGYTCNISGDSTTGFTVENSLYYNITTKKVWDDFNNKFSTRPDDITLDLYKVYTNRTEELVDTRVISELEYKTNVNSGNDFDWSTEPFTDLYYTKEFKYEVRERDVADYEQKYSNTLSSSNGTVEQLWTITNKLDVDMVDISITKVWENIPVENRGLPKFTLSIEGLYGRNDEITSYKMSSTEVKKDSHTFKIEVPKYIIDDIETNYILTETYPYSGVTAEITGNVKDGFNVINRPALKIEVKKVWDDGGNAFDTRPEGPIYFDICSVDENDQVID